MPNVGMGELVLIMAIALIIFGPKKLPEIGKGIGKALREFNKAKTDFMESINVEMDHEERPRPSSTYAVNDTPSYEDEHAYPHHTPALESGDAYGSSHSVTHASAVSAEGEDALPYGSDFHAVDGDSQPSFRAAPPDTVPASMASNHAALTGEGKA